MNRYVGYLNNLDLGDLLDLFKVILFLIDENGILICL